MKKHAVYRPPKPALKEAAPTPVIPRGKRLATLRLLKQKALRAARELRKINDRTYGKETERKLQKIARDFVNEQINEGNPLFETGDGFTPQRHASWFGNYAGNLRTTHGEKKVPAYLVDLANFVDLYVNQHVDRRELEPRVVFHKPARDLGHAQTWLPELERGIRSCCRGMGGLAQPSFKYWPAKQKGKLFFRIGNLDFVVGSAGKNNRLALVYYPGHSKGNAYRTLPLGTIEFSIRNGKLKIHGFRPDRGARTTDYGVNGAPLPKGKALVVHLGNIGRMVSGDPFSEKTIRYLERFAGTKNMHFVGIDKRPAEVPERFRARWTQIEGGFMEGLEKLPDNSAKVISSDLSAGEYDYKHYNVMEYSRMTASTAYSKLRPGGKLLLAVVAEGLGELMAELRKTRFKKVSMRGFREHEYDRTYWTKRYAQEGKRLCQITLEK